MKRTVGVEMSEQPQTRMQLLDQLVQIAHKLRDLEQILEKSLEEQLAHKELEDLFATVFQQAIEGIVIVRQGTIIVANPRICEILGAPLQQIIGSAFEQYVRPDHVAEAVHKYEEHLAGSRLSVSDRTKLLKQDGSPVDVEFNAAKIAYQGQEAVLFLVTDTTYVMKAEGELLRLRQYEISFVEHVNIWLDVLDASGNVAIWNRAAEEISGYSKKEVVGNAKIWEYLYPDRSYRDEVFSRAMGIINRGESVQGFETTILTRAGHKKTISWYSRDLKDDEGHTIGSIAIGLDITALRESSLALTRANEALTLAYDQTIEGWSRALDLRDKETEGHSQRVTGTTLRLARLAGMSEAELSHVRRGALLHDIGKLGVPDAILLKPGQLSDDEWAHIRKHPELGYMLLSPIAYLHSALDIPYCHHEKWDGTGYPRGLKGEQIPLAARLFAVADIWDAIRSDRPNRKGWSTVQAMEHIKSLAGTHLDPRAVEYFFSIDDLEH